MCDERYYDCFLVASEVIVLGLLITKIIQQRKVPRTFTFMMTGTLICVPNNLLERPLIHSEVMQTEIELIATITLVIVLFNEGQHINDKKRKKRNNIPDK